VIDFGAPLFVTDPVDTHHRATLPVTPPRVKGFTVEDTFDDGRRPVQTLIDELMEKLRAEDARLRRLLPAPPPGLEWHGELQASDAMSFERGTTQYRIVYRLEKVRP
jgi:hypothetical protein